MINDNDGSIVNNSNDNIEFQILDWRFHEQEIDDIEKGEFPESEKQYVIDLYGRTIDNKTVYASVIDYTPFFYVEIPSGWKNNLIDTFINILKRQVYYKMKNSLKEYTCVKRCKFRGFTNYKKFQFIRLIFKNYDGFRSYERILRKPIYDKRLGKSPKKYKLYESNIEPFFRCMHIRDINACGWVSISNDKYINIQDAPTICNYNIETQWSNLNKVEKTLISPIVIAAFDIECTSGDGSFPQAERASDKVIQIGTTFSRYGETECFYKHIITLGSCDAIPGADVESYRNEKDVLIAWTKMLRKMDPDVITGYNIFGFDYKYLHNRSKKLGCYHQFSKLCRTESGLTRFVEKELKSAALGDNILYYYDMKGRVQIDLMKVIQKDYKLESYKLDSVAAYFIRENIISIDIQENTYDDSVSEELDDYVSVIHTKSTYGLKGNQYISIYYDDGLSDNKYNDGKKYFILNLTSTTITISGKLDGEEMDVTRYRSYWCQAKDDVSPQEIFKLQEKSSKDRAKIARYCLQDCILCNRLVAKLQVITNNVGMANVCNVPLSYLFLRGQGVKIFSLVSKKCRTENHLLPVIKKPYKPPEDAPPKPMTKLEEEMKKMGFNMDPDEEDDNDGYEGATVFPPDVGVHFEPVPVLDYASLYPRSMIHRNLSHEYLVDDDAYDNIPGYIYRNVTYINKASQPMVCRYAQKEDGSHGIIPMILQDLLDARSRTKKEMAKETDPFKKSVLDGLQLAYKITANSLYGQIGAKTSPIFLKEIAASTTATGREMLTLAKEFNETIFLLLTNLVLDKKFKTYRKKFNELFDGKILDFDISDDYKKLLTDAPDLIVSVKDERFIDKKLGHTCRKDFVDYFKKEIKEILGDYRIKPKVIYGDSVVGNTPLIVKENGYINITTIDNLHSDKKWEEYGVGKRAYETNDLEIWTETGWTKVNRIIKHITNKKIYRVLTHTGCVDVTEDHSLVDSNNNKIAPRDCVTGTTLLQSYPTIDKVNSSMTEDEAWVMGFFMADGNCGSYNSKWGVKHSWAINNNNMIYLNEAKEKLEKVEGFKFKILDTLKSSGVYKLVPNCEKIKLICEKYRKLLYFNNGKSKEKIVPVTILQNNVKIQEAFWKGYYMGNGDKDNNGYTRCECKNQVTAQTLYMLLKNIGYNVSINARKDKQNIFRLTGTKLKNRKVLNAIKKLEDMSSYYYADSNEITVYDLETENHHFQAGVGNIIVHNTDSVFINFYMYDPVTNEVKTDQEALEKGIKLGILCGLVINKFMPYPHDLEYEKTFWPFCILTKKRYVGNLYEENPNKYDQKSMGIVLKRRDNAKIVKIVCGGIVRSILRDKSSKKAVEFTKDSLYNILCEKYPIDKFIITKTLRSDYKDRTRQTHAVLADRMAERDPGNKPQSNDRIPYAFITVKKETKLQGDRVEHPDYIASNNLKLDYLFYITNQIMKPSVQFLALLVKKPEQIFNEFIVMEDNRRKGKRPVGYYMDNDDGNMNGIKIDDDIDDFDVSIKTTKNKSKENTSKSKSKSKSKSVEKDPDSLDFVEYDADNGGFIVNI